MNRVRPWLKREREREKRKKKEFRLDSNEFGFICAGVSNMGGYIRNA